MGFGPKDNSQQIVNQQRRDEEQRQSLIRQGNERISSIFDSTFTPEFFNKAVDDYTGYYRPILDDQYKDYHRDTVLDLANRGTSASTSAGRRYGNLQETYDRGLDKIRNDAFDFRKGLQGDAINAESDMRGLAQAGVDPSSISNLAIGRTRLLSQPATYNPLTDFFEQFAAQAFNRNAAKSAGYVTRPMPGSNRLLFNSGSNSSVRTVN